MVVILIGIAIQVIAIFVMLLQFVLFPSLTMYQIGLIGWIAGALYSFCFPFYLKIRSGELTLRDLNVAYLVSFLSNLAIGVVLSLILFETFLIPEGGQLIVLITAFWFSAGLDSQGLKQILKAIGAVDKAAERWNFNE